VNSIDAMTYDMKRQLLDLRAMPLPEPAVGKAILAGSGDSYAAAVAAYYLSSGRTMCCQPADILSDPTIADNASVYFVSISGKTKTNVLAAESMSRAGANTVAVTADASSPLAAACDSIFALKFVSAGKTSGTISFTASLLACARIAANAECPTDLKSIYGDAARKAARLAESIKVNNIVVLGNATLYPAAMYGSLKFSEVLGSRTSAYPLEDFCHAPLFGHRGDQVIILGREDDISISRQLNSAGIEATYIDCRKNELLGSVFYATFFMQHLALDIAKKKNMKECYFLQDKKLLCASSDIIY
jgi:glutamine---fructose-6-phosphate transaminase (isomerizing)